MLYVSDIDGQILDFHIENHASKWKLKAHVLERKASIYYRRRSETGAPVVGRINPPLSQGVVRDQGTNGENSYL